jgi:hemerythrin-like domain-containing protein
MRRTMLTRRRLMCAAGSGGALLLLSGTSLASGTEDEDRQEVGAVEDLMREHGVLRRALCIYEETAKKLQAGAGPIDMSAIGRTAALFRRFGEDYHEKKLEEAHVFPAVKKGGGPAAAHVDVLTAQHARGRVITDYIVAATKQTRLRDAQAFARTLEAFALMYQNHAAREDTLVFPAWKEALSASQLAEMGEEFEDIERKAFGKDGFQEAVEEIGVLEEELGYADIGQFTAPPPPPLS